VQLPAPSVPATAGGELAAVDFSPMAERDEGEFIPPEVKGVDDPVIADAQAKLGSPLQAVMRKVFQVASQLPNPGFQAGRPGRRKPEENRVELAGVNLRGLFHGPSASVDTYFALAQIGLAALDAGDKLRIKFSLVFEVIGKPILKLQRLPGWQLANFRYDGFKVAHGKIYSRV
jgi:hypothetical protein